MSRWFSRKGPLLLLAMLFAWFPACGQPDPYAGWGHVDSLFLLTTPEGADIPAQALEKDFPVLIRLHGEWFPFAGAKPDGGDIRFSTPAGAPLPYQIETWDRGAGTASIWVKVPTLAGNARQALRMHWGNPAAASASDGAAVFSAAAGFRGVWHLGGSLADETGATSPVNSGTQAGPGMIGGGRRFQKGQGVLIGNSIATFPSGAGERTTQAWFRAEAPAALLGWGKEQSAGKQVMQLRSPPHIHMDCYFADVTGTTTMALGGWHHVAHTYRSGQSKIYVDGKLDGSSSPALATPTPSGMWLGGWYGNYGFAGDLDEVRVSGLARSEHWVRLEYENQKPLPTLAGWLVPSGSAFGAPARLTVAEGGTVRITAQAGGALKAYWILKGNGGDTVIAVDRLNLEFSPGRVPAGREAVVTFKAVYPAGPRTQDIAIAITEALPDPVFTLSGPPAWNGRDTVVLTPAVSNRADLEAKGVGEIRQVWDIAGPAVIKQAQPGRLLLTRAQGAGRLTVTVTLDNGGTPVSRSHVIQVQPPETDPWVQRIPEEGEQPEARQFYARDDKQACTVPFRGTLDRAADSVFVRYTGGGQVRAREARALGADRKFAFATPLAPGLVEYRAELGAKSGSQETVIRAVEGLLCGDAYIVEGQSNAEATQFGTDDNPATSPWIRTYGSMGNGTAGAWATAVHRADGGLAQVGYWGLEIARKLVTDHQVPICILNGAVGGTRIDEHQRNPGNPTDAATIYGRLLARVRKARLTHGIRAVLWHQGENDQGAEAPTGKLDWETYQAFFIDMAAAWKEDYPNLKSYYLFQIWPGACGSSIQGSDNMLREVQRTLPRLFSHMGIMSTLGVRPGSSCHYVAAGYAGFARLLTPLLQRDFYGKSFPASITPPDLKAAWYATSARDEVVLEFDQPVAWKASLASEFYLDGLKGKVASGSVAGNILRLKLGEPATATKVSYLDSRSWSEGNILLGTNGIAALTFWQVPIAATQPDPVAVGPGTKAPRGSHPWGVYRGGELILSGISPGAPLEIEVGDLRGATLLTRYRVPAVAGTHRLTLPGLGPGIHILRVRQAGRLVLGSRLAVY